MAYSILRGIGDGVQDTFAVNFTLGFLKRSDVRFRVVGEVDGALQPIYRTLTWINDGMVKVNGGAPANGAAWIMSRNTVKTSLVHDYSDGEPITEENLDDSNLQSMMLLHEVLDGRFEEGLANDLNLGGFRITNMADATEPGNAVTLRQLDALTEDVLNAVDDAQASAAAALVSQNAAAASAADAADDAASASQDADDAAISAGQALAAAGTAQSWRNETLTFRNAAEGFRNEALTFRNAAEGFKNTAGTSASNASNSESNALTYRNAAEGFKNDAEGFKNTASTQATNAGNSATAAAASALLAASPLPFCGRLTLTSGDPLGLTNVVGGTTLYCAPINGNLMALHNGTSWVVVAFNQFSLALTGLTALQGYDVFVYLNSGVPTLELQAWTNNTTRAVPIVLQDGVYVKQGAVTRRYAGSFMAQSATTTDSHDQNRYLYNYYNRRNMRLSLAGVSTSYAQATWRIWNGGATNRCAFFNGTLEDEINLECFGYGSNNAVGTSFGLGMALDSTSGANTRTQITSAGAGDGTGISSRIITQPGSGYHYIAGVENTGTTAFTMSAIVSLLGYFRG